MIRIDALWLCTQPQDMRAGAERLMAQVVHTLGRASAHHGYLFANARATRMKLLVHDGFGVRGREYGVNQDSGVFFDTDAHEALIGQLKLRRLERFTYEYDFGDLWMHDLRIEATLPLDPKRVYPVCIAGRRAAPPEDCGGPHAFMATRSEYTLIGESRSRHEFEDLLDGVEDQEWYVLRHYHPDRFDRRAVNCRLAALAPPSQER